MTQPTTQASKKLNRKRELNVIYFIDSHQTRSFKLPLGRVKFIAAILAVVGIWAMGSFWVLIKMANQQEHADQRITEIQGVIFEFQTRYGQVYETAYPKGQRLIAEAKAVATNKQDKPDDKPVEEVESPKTAKVQKLAAKPARPKPVATPQPTPKVEIDVEKPTVKIEDTKFSKAGDSLVLHFSIRNTITPKKALGYMWGVASYRTADGDTLYIGYPRGIDVNGDGNATNTNSATRYNIRRFKPVRVNFPSPQGVPGKFEDVKVMVMDREGNRQTYNLAVNVDVGFTPAPLPEPTTSAQPAVAEPKVQSSTEVKDDVVPAGDQGAEASEVDAP